MRLDTLWPLKENDTPFYTSRLQVRAMTEFKKIALSEEFLFPHIQGLSLPPFQ